VTDQGGLEGSHRQAEGGIGVIDSFVAHLRYRGFTAKTIKRRRDTLRLLSRYLAPLELGSATPELIEQFLAERPAARTRHAYRSDIRTFYRWACERGIIAVDPSAGIASVKVPRSLPRPLDATAVLACLLTASVPCRQMIALAIFAGLRCFEIAHLQFEDVWYHETPPMIVVRNGKGRTDRSVPMHPVLHDMFTRLRGAGPVFPGRVAEHVRPESVAAAIRRQFDRHDIHGTPHQLRHTFGTELARASGGDMVLVATLMGHASMGTTMGYVKLAHSAGANIVSGMYDGDAA